ncbi:MAG: hypothetical protein KDA87_02820, partial [Planctomycetales bacterium]|nr:hypothetical protein [Planctomycetales bacterium]
MVFFKLRALLSLVVVAWIVCAVPTTWADQTDRIGEVHIGFGGTYKVGHWTPLWLQVAAGEAIDGTLQVTVPDGSGHDCTFVSDVHIPANEPTRLEALVKFGRIDCRPRIQLIASDGRQWSRTCVAAEIPSALPSTSRMILSLGTQMDLQKAADAMRRTGDSRPVTVVSVSRAEQLPGHVLAYEAVDLVVLTTRNNSLAYSAGQTWQTALMDYVRTGGRCLWSCGQNPETAADFGLDSIQLAKFEGTSRQREAVGLEGFVGAKSSLVQAAGQPLTVAKLAEVKGRVIVREGFGANQIPIVVQGAAGLGTVVFTAFDLDDDLIANWSDQTELIAKLLSLAFVSENGSVVDVSVSQSHLARVGYADMVGQLRSAMDQFTGVMLVPFSLIALLIVIFLLLIGPFDFWLHRRWTKRPEWTWLTFPAMILLCSAAAVWFAAYAKGRGVRANQLQVLDVDLSQRMARGTIWTSYFGDKGQARQAEVTPRWSTLAADRTSVATSWQGLPGDGFGGMANSIRANASGDSNTYRMQANPLRIQPESLFSPTWSSRSLVTRWSQDQL